MAGSIKQQAVGPVTVQGSGSALSNNARVKVGTLDNTSNLAPTWDFQLATGFSVAPTPAAGIVVGLYGLPWIDGTNPASADTTTPNFPDSTFLGNFQVKLSQTGVQYLPVQACQLSALKYDLWIDNQSGQSMSSGWTFIAAGTDSQYT